MSLRLESGVEAVHVDISLACEVGSLGEGGKRQGSK